MIYNSLTAGLIVLIIGLHLRTENRLTKLETKITFVWEILKGGRKNVDL